MNDLINDFRHSIYYKYCGIICTILTVISISLYIISGFVGHNEGALLVLPLLLISIAVLILNIVVFVLLTGMSLVKTPTEGKTSIISDIGYIFSLAFIIFVILFITFKN